MLLDKAQVILAGEEDSDWYQGLVDDCKAIITEAVFTSRWALVEGYHMLGERITTDWNYKEFAKGNKGSVQGLAQKLGTSERTLYYAIQFFEKYPRLDMLPEGKNISWNKIVTKYLPSRADGESQPADVCPACGRKMPRV